MKHLPLWIQPFVTMKALYAFAWLAALGIAAGRIVNGHLAFQDYHPMNHPDRRIDGNEGHRSIDFGGQWMMGRILATGHGRELYSRPRQWEVAQQAYPRANKAPTSNERDAEVLLQHFMGRDDPHWLESAGAVATLMSGTTPYEQAAIAIQAAPLMVCFSNR